VIDGRYRGAQAATAAALALVRWELPMPPAAEIVDATDTCSAPD
jgi:hypothetical protein